MSEDTMDPPVNASVWARSLFDYLTTHAQNEGRLLESYVQAAEKTDSRAFAYVVALLAEDERRHHRQFIELASSLKSEAELSDVEPAIPRLDFDRGDQKAMLDLTRRLVANEEKDAAELKRLNRELRDVRDTTLWSLLVETMQLDTKKHLAILRFVERHASSGS